MRLCVICVDLCSLTRGPFNDALIMKRKGRGYTPALTNVLKRNVLVVPESKHPF